MDQDGRKMDQGGLKMAQDGSKWGPRWAQDGSKRAPRGAQESPKTAPRAPKSAPRAPQEGSKRRCVRLTKGDALRGPLFLFGSTMAPRPSPNVSKRGPRLPQEGPTGHQNGSKIGPRELQEASKKDDSSPANCLWMGQDGPKTPQDDNVCVCVCVSLFYYMLIYFPSPNNSPGHRLWMGWWGYAKRQQLLSTPLDSCGFLWN